MLALGCIQSLKCNQNTCPVGITTQDKGLEKGLVVSDKAQRVANFHEQTVKSLVEMIAAANMMSPSELNRSHINKRMANNKVLKFDEIYPYTEINSLLA
jgi:glutamate synthase domain-containing protein 2